MIKNGWLLMSFPKDSDGFLTDGKIVCSWTNRSKRKPNKEAIIACCSDQKRYYLLLEVVEQISYQPVPKPEMSWISQAVEKLEK